MAHALSKREYSPGAHRGDATRATGAGAGRAARSGSRVAPAGGMVAAGRLLCAESTHAISAAVSTEDQMRPFPRGIFVLHQLPLLLMTSFCTYLGTIPYTRLFSDYVYSALK